MHASTVSSIVFRSNASNRSNARNTNHSIAENVPFPTESFAEADITKYPSNRIFSWSKLVGVLAVSPHLHVSDLVVYYRFTRHVWLRMFSRCRFLEIRRVRCFIKSPFACKYRKFARKVRGNIVKPKRTGKRRRESSYGFNSARTSNFQYRPVDLSCSTCTVHCIILPRLTIESVWPSVVAASIKRKGPRLPTTLSFSVIKR